MAQFPCSRCGQRYRGPQQTAYPAIVDGTDAERAKMRLCPGDFKAHTEWALTALVEATVETEGDAKCCVCGNDGVTLAVFDTIYAAHAERVDLWGRLCVGCLPDARVALFGATTAP
jgi:hypothetical protein